MNCVERYKNTMSFNKPDRVPMIEWATWWDKTIDRWKGEGLSSELSYFDLYSYFGLDLYKQYWVSSLAKKCPKPAFHGGAIIKSFEEYNDFKEKRLLFPDFIINKEELLKFAERQKNGEVVVWLTLDGFFWNPRKLLGIEPHLYAFYDDAELMHQINKDTLEYNMRIIDEFCELCVPCFMTLAEDMSYNNGPMIGKELFDEFIGPYYKVITKKLKEYGINIIVDSDGDITKLIPWFKEVGVEGLLPLERQAGVDLIELRKIYPDFMFIGGYDKMVMKHGEQAMRAEFERLLPVMKQGGYIPSVDHQTPPDVSIENYKIYMKLYKEYCNKATQ